MKKNNFGVGPDLERRELTGSEILQYSKSTVEKLRQKASFKRKRNSVFFFSVLLLVLFIGFISSSFSTGEEERPFDKEFVAVLSSSVQDIDPAYAQSDGEITVSRLIFQGLVTYDSQGKLVPALAENWVISEDGKIITFYLKKDVYFHNGRNVTAGDCKFTWERSLRVSAPTAYIFTNILGADAILADQSIELSGVQAIDDYTLRVQLVQPQPNFISLLAQPAAAVLDRFELVEQGVNYARPGGSLPSGIGPFQMIDWQQGKEIVLGINENYFGESPWLERIKFELNLSAKDALVAFDAGEVDMLQDLRKEDMHTWWGRPEQLNLYTEPVRLVYFVALNDQRAPFQEPAVRNAIMTAISANNALTYSRDGQGAPLSGTFSDYWQNFAVGTQQNGEGNIELAKNILKNAGYENGQGIPAIRLYCSDHIGDKAVAQSIQSDLSALGLQVEISSMSYKDLRLAIRRGDVSFYTMEYADKGGGIDTFFYEMIDSRYQKVINSSFVDAILRSAYFANDSQKYQLFREAETILTQNHSLKFLYTMNTAILLNEKWQGIRISNGGNVLLEFMQEKADVLH